MFPKNIIIHTIFMPRSILIVIILHFSINSRKSAAKNPAPIPRARNAGETDSFASGARDDNDRRYQPPRQQLRQSHGSKHQLRLEEGVSPVHSSQPGANEFGNQDQNIRDRYRDRH